MQTPEITDPFSTRLGVDYIEEPFVFYTADGPLDDFAGCTISGGIYLRGRQMVDLSSYALIAAPSTVNIAVPAAVMAKLGAGDFKVSLELHTPSGIQDLLNYALKVVPG